MVAPRSESDAGRAANDAAVPARRMVNAATDARGIMWVFALCNNSTAILSVRSAGIRRPLSRFGRPMDRQHRRELKHDRFVDEIGTLSGKAKENQRLLIMITGAVVALAVIGYGIYFYRSSREQRAQEALAKAIEIIESPLAPPPGGQPMPNA